MQSTLFTIGYEGVTIDDVVNTLRRAHVTVLLDVRAVPLSRKPGFSKNKLAGKLQEHGIQYVGLKGLGTPPEGREAARKGRVRELENIFGTHLETEIAQRDLLEAVKISSDAASCLLCFEHSPACCHRRLVAERMIGQTGQTVEHLNPVLTNLL